MDVNVTVTVKAPELATAILALADAFGDWVNAAAGQPQGQAETKQARKTKADAPAAEGSSSEPTATAAEPAQAPAAAAITITLEEVRAKLASLSQSGHQPAVKQLLTSYGVSQLSKVPPEKYPELLEAARKIA